MVDGFRGLNDFEATFEPGLNIVVGANGAGKTALIDALRTVLAPANRFESSAFDVRDFSNGSDEATIELTYDGLNLSEKAVHLEALDIVGGQIRIGKHFRRDNQTYRGYTPINTLGRGSSVEDRYPGRKLLQHIYIGPLRDARRELASYSGNRLKRLLQFLADDDALADLSQLLAEHDNSLAEFEAIQTMREQIAARFEELSNYGSTAEPLVAPASSELASTLRRLRLGIHEMDQDWEVDQIGLGYANILYLATVLVELRSPTPGEHRVILMEEPEAHLHPQLQLSLVKALKRIASQVDENVQIILTTHSPTIAAAAGVDSLSGVARTTEGASHWKLNVEGEDRNKLSRFFLSRRPEVLFSDVVLLVEGVSEEILIPVLLELHMNSSGQTAADQLSEFDKSKAFPRSGQLIAEKLAVAAVHSVDFKPYVSLLTSCGGTLAGKKKVFVLTDTDSGNSQQTGGYGHAGEKRACELKSLASARGFPAADFEVLFADTTFEKAIIDWAFAEVEPVAQSIIKIISSTHPVKWQDCHPPWILPSADSVWSTIQGVARFSKGGFAQRLAEELVGISPKLPTLPMGLHTVAQAVENNSVLKRTDGVTP